MKKITLFVATLIASSSLFSQSTFKWNGNQTDQIWDYATANWLDPSFPIPLPKTFIEGSNAIFDETSTVGSDTLKINGVITVNNLDFTGSKDYVLRSTSTTSDELTGVGTLTKDGTCTVVMDLKNTMTGGTVIKNGKLMMEKQTTANIFGSKIAFAGNGTANFATTSSSSYPSVSIPIEIQAGVNAKVELSRYSYFASPITGTGDLTIAAGGERTMMGTSKSGGIFVDWTNFTGNVTVEPMVVSGVNPGYYGLLLPITKTFDYTDFATVDSMFANRKLTLKAGVGLTGASGVRCWLIGELQAEDETAFLGGYGAGKSNSPKIYYMFGSSNTDVVCPVSLKDVGGGDYNYVGLIKVGTGKYVFTSTKSLTQASSGVQVNQGTFLIDIPVTDATTGLGRCKSTVMTINEGAIGGGNGRLTGKVQVDSLGTLVIGNGAIGELVLADTQDGNISSPLVVKNGGKIVFKVSDKNNFDKLSTNSSATFNGGTILIRPASTYALNDGDSITILTTNDRISETDSFKLETTGFAENLKITAVVDTIAGGGSKIILAVQGSAQAVNTVTAKNVTVYPNPSVGDFNFTSLDSEIKSIEILNLQGQIVRSEYMNSKSVNLNLSNLSKGIYYSKINTVLGTKVEKLILK